MKKLLIFSIVLLIAKGSIDASTNDSLSKSGSSNAKNIILMIGDGMGLAQVYATFTANKGLINLFHFPVVGLSLTNSADNYVTDSAAGATALSTGKKTKNYYVARGTDNKNLETILEIAKDNGLSTGLVATSQITHATPASFIAHVSNRNSYDSIALFFLSGNADVFIGGGLENFIKRLDNKDLTVDLKKMGYSVCTSIDEVKNCSNKKLAGLIAASAMPKISDGREDMLTQSTKKAIDLLHQNKKGFFLMVEGSQIDWGNHANDIDYVIKETQDFDKAVGTALDFARKDSNTLVIVLADHESGGLTLTGGNIENGTVDSKFSTLQHTAVPIIVYTYGPGSENYSGVFDNTQIFYKMLSSYGFDNNTKN